MNIHKKLFITPNILLIITAWIFVLFFLLKALYLEKTVYGDGIFYFSWLHSVIVDQDINFHNEYAFFNVQQLITKNGLLGNQFAIGPALFWSPIYVVVHTILKGDGFSFFYQVSIGLLSVGYAIAGLILLYRALNSLFAAKTVLIATVATAFGTNLFFYGSLDPVNSHAVSFFAATVLLNIIIHTYPNYLLAGFFAGVLGAIRIQDSAFIGIPLLLLIYQFVIYKTKIIIIGKHVFQLIIGWSIPLLLQFGSWYLLYGDIRIPYLERGYGFNFFNSQGFSVLFSHNNGLFFWTPLVLIAVIGLFTQYKKKLFHLSFITLLFFIWQTYLIGSWSIWWQGASFSGRMYISLIPFLSLGLASLFSHYQTNTFIKFLFIILPIINIFFSFYYLFIT